VALAAADLLAHTDPANPKVLDERLRDYDLLASIERGNGASDNLGDANGALNRVRSGFAIAQRIEALSPQDREVPRYLARFALRVGDTYVNLGQRSAAMQHYRLSLQIIDNAGDPAVQKVERLHCWIDRSPRPCVPALPLGSSIGKKRKLGIPRVRVCGNASKIQAHSARADFRPAGHCMWQEQLCSARPSSARPIRDIVSSVSSQISETNPVFRGSRRNVMLFL